MIFVVVVVVDHAWANFPNVSPPHNLPNTDLVFLKLRKKRRFLNMQKKWLQMAAIKDSKCSLQASTDGIKNLNFIKFYFSFCLEAEIFEENKKWRIQYFSKEILFEKYILKYLQSKFLPQAWAQVGSDQLYCLCH